MFPKWKWFPRPAPPSNRSSAPNNMALEMNRENHVSTPTSGKSTPRSETVLDHQPGLTADQGPKDSSKLDRIPCDKPPFGKMLSPS